jgi:hypothetical protein
MKRRLTALLATMGVALVSMGAPAYATHDTDVDMFPPGHNGADRWSQQVADEDYCYTNFVDHLSATAYGNMVSTTTSKDDDWANLSAIETVFHPETGDPECATTYNWDNVADSAEGTGGCDYIDNNFPGMSSRITYQPMSERPASVVASTIRCDLNNNGFYDFFWVNFQREHPDLDWHFDVSTSTVPGGTFDFGGVLLHELGHAYGFTPLHFSPNIGACDLNSAYSTMCPNASFGAYNGIQSDGEAWRSLGSHDLGAANDEYP